MAANTPFPGFNENVKIGTTFPDRKSNRISMQYFEHIKTFNALIIQEYVRSNMEEGACYEVNSYNIQHNPVYPFLTVLFIILMSCRVL